MYGILVFFLVLSTISYSQLSIRPDCQIVLRNQIRQEV
jgi:hypothetical protein